MNAKTKKIVKKKVAELLKIFKDLKESIFIFKVEYTGADYSQKTLEEVVKAANDLGKTRGAELFKTMPLIHINSAETAISTIYFNLFKTKYEVQAYITTTSLMRYEAEEDIRESGEVVVTEILEKKYNAIQMRITILINECNKLLSML